jgi:hypothetical protein
MRANKNKSMFIVGILFMVVAAIMLLGDFLETDSSAPVMLGFLGILFITTSGVRPMK